jgi:hypothetical protein
MGDAKQTSVDLQGLFADMNTRLREIEERGKMSRERILLLGKNLVNIKTETESQLHLLQREQEALKRDVEKIRRALENVMQEASRFVKREELAYIERMLKDFQPLDFARKKDLESLREGKTSSSEKHIKSQEPSP